MGGFEWPSRSSAEELPLVVQIRKLADHLGHHPVEPPQNLSHLQMVGTCEMAGLLFQSVRVSTTQGNNRINRRSPGEDPMTVSQKPEASNQTADSLQRTFSSEDVWAEGYSV